MYQADKPRIDLVEQTIHGDTDLPPSTYDSSTNRPAMEHCMQHETSKLLAEQTLTLVTQQQHAKPAYPHARGHSPMLFGADAHASDRCQDSGSLAVDTEPVTTAASSLLIGEHVHLELEDGEQWC